MLADKTSDYIILNKGNIGIVDKTITKDAMTLIAPQSNKLSLCLEFVNRREVKTFKHATDISQVKDVMELKRCTWKLLQACIIELKRSLSYSINSSLDIV